MKFLKRHFIKSLTWRIIGSIDTFLISWLIVGNINDGIYISSIDFFTKIILFFFHERLWYRYIKLKNDLKRHLYKTISWRLIGTFDTFIISYIITGSSLFSVAIGFTETVTKMILYFLHERLWFKFVRFK